MLAVDHPMSKQGNNEAAGKPKDCLHQGLPAQQQAAKNADAEAVLQYKLSLTDIQVAFAGP